MSRVTFGNEITAFNGLLCFISLNAKFRVSSMMPYNQNTQYFFINNAIEN